MIRHYRLVRTVPRPLTISVIVPCAAAHLSNLMGVISNLRAQTRKPDEVVIAVSGCARSKISALENTAKHSLGCDVVVVHDPAQAWAGANRNRAAAAAKGDVLICQDADDLSHPQRVEIIASLFEHYAIDHLMHFFSYLTVDRSVFSIPDAVRVSSYCDDFTKFMKAEYRPGPVRHVHNGNCAVMRQLARAVKWPDLRRGQDVAFSRLIYARTKNTVVTSLPLLTYRQNLSTKARP